MSGTDLDSDNSGREVWTIQKLLTWTTQHFIGRGIDSARLDAEILLSHVLDCRRLDLYLKFDQPMKAAELAAFRELVKRRSRREPVAYIVGNKEFYGREFQVGTGALVPRPETEHLIDAVLDWARQNDVKDKSLDILDVGTGSGCIAVTLAAELPGAYVKALDISPDAIKWAQINGVALGVNERLEFVCQDFSAFEGRESSFDVIASNPPYIGRDHQSELAVDVKDHEPEPALYGGSQGPELWSNWVDKWVKLLKPGGLLVFEIGFDQGVLARETLLADQRLNGAQVINDYAGHPRIARATKNKE